MQQRNVFPALLNLHGFGFPALLNRSNPIKFESLHIPVARHPVPQYCNDAIGLLRFCTAAVTLPKQSARGDCDTGATQVLPVIGSSNRAPQAVVFAAAALSGGAGSEKASASSARTYLRISWPREIAA